MEELFSEFSTVTFHEWKEKITKDLKGVDFDSLIQKDRNGLSVFPFYNKENSVDSFKAISGNPDWLLTQRFKMTGEKATNKAVLQSLNAGANALVFDLANQQNCDFETLLSEVGLPYIHTVFRVGYPAVRLVYNFKDYLLNVYPAESPKNCFFYYDPVADYIQSPEEMLPPKAADYLDFYSSAKSYFRLSVDAAIYQNAGANSVWQLALAIAHLNEYLHFLQKENTTENPVKLLVNMATGTLFFEEIAKLRALRVLIPLLLEEYQQQATIALSVETSQLYRSPVDAYTNLLRDTVAGMSGVVAGCDYLEIHAFDREVKDNGGSDFGHHLARNQQLIFKEESYLNKVADMSSGSFFIEKRTEEMAKAGWEIFQEIEKKGGLLAAFDSGWIQENLSQQAMQLMQQYKEGEKVLIGVNKYLNPTEPESEIQHSVSGNAEKGLKPLNLAREILKKEE